MQDDNAKRTLAEIEQHFAPGKEMIAQCEADVEALADKVELS